MIYRRGHRSAPPIIRAGECAGTTAPNLNRGKSSDRSARPLRRAVGAFLFPRLTRLSSPAATTAGRSHRPRPCSAGKVAVRDRLTAACRCRDRDRDSGRCCGTQAAKPGHPWLPAGRLRPCGSAGAHCREDLRRGEWIPAFRRRVDLRVAGWPPGGESAVPGRVGEAEPFSF